MLPYRKRKKEETSNPLDKEEDAGEEEEALVRHAQNYESSTEDKEPKRIRSLFCAFSLLLVLGLFAIVNLINSSSAAVPVENNDMLTKPTNAEPSLTGTTSICQLTNEMTNNDDDSRMRSSRRVHLLMYIGIEGTGHHLLKKLTTTLAETLITSSNSPKLTEILHTRICKYTKGKAGEHVPSEIVTSLDDATNEMDALIDSSPTSTVFALSGYSNPFLWRLFSGVDPIDLVELAERSRHNVSLSLLILHRNFTKVIWSTALGRKFNSVAKKVNELQNSATVLNSQLGGVPLCSWRTFDIDDYSRHKDDYNAGLAKFFRVNISRVELEMKKYETRIAAAPKESNYSKYDTLWTPEDLLYVKDAFERSSVKHLWERLTESRYNLRTDFVDVGCDCIWGA